PVGTGSTARWCFKSPTTASTASRDSGSSRLPAEINARHHEPHDERHNGESTHHGARLAACQRDPHREEHAAEQAVEYQTPSPPQPRPGRAERGGQAAYGGTGRKDQHGAAETQRPFQRGGRARSW